MTDKSFGDHMSRNVVKNPLLASAVTGVSIEDLTHNAVLLPVSRSQDAITRSDQNVGSKDKPLGYPDYATPINQSGDAQTITSQSQTAYKQLNTNQNIKIEKRFENKEHGTRDTVSKASVKSEDDFDVNEYFARLHGTRYISAPLSSTIKEDCSANLAESEENLEEINLNEPDRVQNESQGLTADIAQNFSQLPTVLPQVASAVFSSFSNMLSMKSKEGTPERAPIERHEAVQHENTVPLMSMPEVKEVAPPPRESSSVGVTSYRLQTKKKYAQIPGLSSGEGHQNLFSQNYNQPPTSVPSYFTPSESISDAQLQKSDSYDYDNIKDGRNKMKTESSAILSIGECRNIDQRGNVDRKVAQEDITLTVSTKNADKIQEGEKNIVELDRDTKNNASSVNEQKDAHIFYNPNDYANIPIENKSLSIENTQSVKQNVYFDPNKNNQNVQSQNTQGYFTASVPQNVGIAPPAMYSSISQNTSVISNPPMPAQSSSSIIPPPPMFSNAPRRDSLSNIGKSVLPPSVARRISSNHPFLKPQPPQTVAFTENIFVPLIPLDSSALPSNPPLCATSHQSAFVQIKSSSYVPEASPSESVLLNPTSSASISKLSSDEPISTTSSNSSTGSSGLLTFAPFAPLTAETSLSDNSVSKTLPPPSGTNIPSSFPPSSSNFMQSTSSIPPPLMTIDKTKPMVPNIANVDKTVPMMFNPLSELQTHSVPNFPPTYESNHSVSAEKKASLSSAPQTLAPTGSTSDSNSFYNPSQSTEESREFTNLPSVKASVLPMPITKPKVEPPKPPVEPPKVTGNTNFRLTKKRPKYYAGPIEGVGDISNNVKPILEPVQPPLFQGAMLTPTVTQEVVNQPLQSTNEPFDISKQSEIIYTPYELGKSQQQNYGQGSVYNTAFDLSRSPTENYEPPKQEGKGFGIIGSLKSKLSAIDINKIQNTVTTFFDPAYNEVKTDETEKQDNASCGESIDFNNQSQNQSNFEIFVPNVDSNQYSQLYGSQNPFQYQTPEYGTPQTLNQLYQFQNQAPCQQNNYYQSQEPFSYYQVEDPNAYPTNYDQNLHMNVYSQHYSTTSQSVTITSTDSNINVPRNVSNESEATESQLEISNDGIETKDVKEEKSNLNFSLSSQWDSSKSFFDKALPHVEVDSKEFQPKQELKTTTLLEAKSNEASIEPNAIKDETEKHMKARLSEDSDTARELDETKALANALASFTLEDNRAQRDSFQKVKEEAEAVPNLDVSSAALLGLSTMLADKSKELSDLENDSHTLISTSKSIDTIFNRGTNASFFDDLSLEKTVEEDKSELDICGTCREVDRPDDKEPESENLTDQLIENITSPIQLLNPVEVPLPESNALLVEGPDFASKQLEEISHITEETIETLQVQSATELLDESIVPASSRTYGWATDVAIGSQVGIPISDSAKNLPINPPIMPDHDFGLANPNAIGFFGNANLFIENIASNTSSDIKPELPFTKEPLVLPRQMSIPTAPPAEDDNKSDETGIDVHSIEQDAKKDFPIFEEFVIEPSEGDDDAIEIKSQDKTSEETSEFDSFTNRVERFKKMEECNVEQIELQKNNINITDTTSPTLPMASYFDTGNYAVDTHYRNSTPSILGKDVNSPNNQMRVPPGFEEEFNRNLRSGLETNTEDKIANVSEIFATETTLNHPIGSKDETNKSISIKEPKDLTETSVRGHKSLSEITNLPEIDYLMFGNNNANNLTKVYDNFMTSEIPLNLSESLEHSELSSVKFKTKGTIDKGPPLSIFSNMSLGTADILNTASDTSDLFEKLKTASPLFSKSEIFEPQFPALVKKETASFDQPNTASNKTENLHLFKDDNLVKQLERQEEIQPLQVENIFSEPNKDIDRDKFIKETPKITLPDPINFFSTTSATPAQSTEDSASGFSRLASYFASPTKTSDNKSFFELSQSQNHYREDSKPLEAIDKRNIEQVLDKQVQSFFEQSNIKETDSNNISRLNEQQYTANVNLIKELTSPQNIEINPELNVKSVNYFTVELKDQGVLKENIGEPNVFEKNKNEKLDLNKTESNNDEFNDDNEFKIRNCKHCCDLNAGHITAFQNVKYDSIFDSSFKVKQCMNDSSEGHRDNNMESVRGESTKNMVTLNMGDESTQQDSQDGVTSSSENRQRPEYTPVKYHWFYRVDVDDKSIWRGFSVVDSNALEKAYLSPDLNEYTVVPTDGGRYDVNVIGRLRTPVYWSDKPTNVRRCSWFYKGASDPRYVPYTESVAEKLEEEYRRGLTSGEWHRRLVLPNNELVVMHGATVMVHFLHTTDAYTSPPMFARGKRVYRNPPRIHIVRDEAEKIDHLLLLVHGVGEHKFHIKRKQSAMRPRVVRRGSDEPEIEDPEPSNIDHLLLLCHGVGSACDMRLRTVEQVVNDFRATSLQLLQSHYKTAFENGTVGRVEVLPISWHATLHSGTTGVDKRLERITLDSIPKLRNFTNDTVLDVLFYTSPVFAQTILETVCKELNRIYRLFLSRNPEFAGAVSVGGHSLGSVILYDLLCHQTGGEAKARTSKQYVAGVSPTTTQPLFTYPQLAFHPQALYALGSPIAIFETIRGVENLGTDFALPTCRNFFNIFHPYDPIAYRVEPLINPVLRGVKAVLIPHHKGRKRMHLELKDTIGRVSSDIKHKLLESIRTTWTNIWKSQPADAPTLERVMEEDAEKESLSEDSKENQTSSSSTDLHVTPEMLGRLNAGRRVDYVLQEAPFEMINEYLFAMTSHVCYWESEDTMLMILREIYDALGVQPDCTVPQHSMTVQREKIIRSDNESTPLRTSEIPSTSRGGT